MVIDQDQNRVQNQVEVRVVLVVEAQVEDQMTQVRNLAQSIEVVALDLEVITIMKDTP